MVGGGFICTFPMRGAFIWVWENHYTMDILQRIAYLASMGEQQAC